MKINWKVRFKHKQFWVAMVALLLVLGNQVAAMFGVDITLISDQITNISETILMILALMGIVIDPMTEGVNDSTRAMRYEKPREDVKW